MVLTEADRREALLALLSEAQDELMKLLETAAPRHPNWNAFLEAQAAWEIFAERQARERALVEAEEGTLYSSVYAGEKERLARARIRDLRSYFERLL